MKRGVILSLSLSLSRFSSRGAPRVDDGREGLVLDLGFAAGKLDQELLQLLRGRRLDPVVSKVSKVRCAGSLSLCRKSEGSKLLREGSFLKNSSSQVGLARARRSVKRRNKSLLTQISPLYERESAPAGRKGASRIFPSLV